jgi:hypothetical protein
MGGGQKMKHSKKSFYESDALKGILATLTKARSNKIVPLNFRQEIIIINIHIDIIEAT